MSGPYWERMDPQDGGPDYRNMVGIPGGVNGDLYAVLVARNVHSMPLVEGVGGHVTNGDTLDESTVFLTSALKRNPPFADFQLTRLECCGLPSACANRMRIAACNLMLYGFTSSGLRLRHRAVSVLPGRAVRQLGHWVGPFTQFSRDSHPRMHRLLCTESPMLVGCLLAVSDDARLQVPPVPRQHGAEPSATRQLLARREECRDIPGLDQPHMR